MAGDNSKDPERRNYERLARKSVLHYRNLEDLRSDHHQTAELCDFSGGGIRFLTSSTLEKNIQLIIELSFTGWREEKDEWINTGSDQDIGRLKAIGAVMWCAPSTETPAMFEVGVRFTGRVR